STGAGASTGAASSGSSTGHASSTGGSTGRASTGGSTGRASTGGSTGAATTGNGSSGASTTGGSSGASTSSGSTGGGTTSAGSTGGSSSGGSTTGATCQNDPGCNSSGEAACDASGDLGTCTLGADGCLHVTGAVACQSDQTCSDGSCNCDANACAGATGTTCLDATDFASCTANADSCIDLGPSQACPAPETCQGAAGQAACACPAAGSATTAVATGCTLQNATACDASSGNIDTCTLVGGCLVWEGPTGAGDPNDCSAEQLVCNTQGGASAACQCPLHTAGQPYFVDPVNGSDSASGIFPTGLQSPAQCSFGTLTNALAVAGGAGGAQTVEAEGTPPATFTKQATGNSETFPITVPAGVTLTTTDPTPNPVDFVVSFDDTAAPHAVILGGAGAAIQGFTIANAGGNAAADALSCTTGAVTVNAVDVDGQAHGSLSRLSTGFTVGGTCAVTANDLQVSDTAAQGLALTGTGTSAFGATAGLQVFQNDVGIAITGSGHFTFTNATVESGSGAGVIINPGTGAPPTVTFVDGLVTDNAGDGIDLVLGSLTLDGTGVTVNGLNGLNVTGGTVTIAPDSAGANASFDDNGLNNAVSAGLNVAGGTVTATGADVSGNMGSGVSVTGGTSVTLTGVTLGNDAAGATYAGNGFDGLYVLAPATTTVNVHGALISVNGARGVELATGNQASNLATVNIDNGTLAGGTIITANGATTNDANVRAGSGKLNVTGTTALPVTISGAIMGQGLNLVGAITALTDVSVDGNAVNGIRVDDAASSAITITDGTISSNGADGIKVDQVPTPSGGAFPLQVDGVTIASNGAAGIDVLGDDGNVGAFLSSCIVSGNTGVGVNVAQPNGKTVQVAVEGNTVELNDAAAATGAGGGFTFTGTAATLSNFYDNKVAGNGGDQILVSGSGGWQLNGASGSCSTANQIFCYAAGSVGLRLSGSGFGATIDASENSWANATPTQGVDYNYSGGFISGITATPACSQAAGAGSCPPAP
ncbi:MAG TPA: right-handed parallel beta-helix repeat-containing protein, partial [Myxococcales bacterium]|nr:right-handed parallel beta-helix repeat-containing protein [Myxococcales bacterium]